jgi:aerobic carbon-monoxide dehydrogenase large subunit
MSTRSSLRGYKAFGPACPGAGLCRRRRCRHRHQPLTLAGQIHGGVAQGIGQTFTEHLVYDKASGQLLSDSLMDYGWPRADGVCLFEMDETPVPTKTNPLGVKGAGEAGNVGALAAIMNAVVDALSPLGIAHIDMPATPEKVWHAIRAADNAEK